jgi:uncharacterized protein (DUF849 family)
VLTVCLNGGRTPEEHPAIPVTPGAVAADAARCAALGAGAAHVHPRDGAGRETLEPIAVAATLNALRAAAPGLRVGMSTGAWIEPRPAARIAAIRSWTVRPDFASVNAHEPGAGEVARALHECGIGVEAGLWTVEAVHRYRAWRVPAIRVLVECMAPNPTTALADAARMLAVLPAYRPPVLLHAEGPAIWPMLREAVRRRLESRVGLEDTLLLPNGSPASGNAALVAAAVALGAA